MTKVLSPPAEIGDGGLSGPAPFAEKPAVSQQRNPKRILVVDDERHIARLLEFVLERRGYAVKVAHDGASAIRMVRDFRPETIILDLVLPDMSGRDVLDAIRAHPQSSDCGVIVLSAHTFELGTQMLDPSARTMQCAKPIAPSRLIETIEKLEEQQRIACAEGAAP
jgi:DNA-binding response OmpR family regulator